MFTHRPYALAVALLCGLLPLATAQADARFGVGSVLQDDGQTRPAPPPRPARSEVSPPRYTPPSSRPQSREERRDERQDRQDERRDYRQGRRDEQTPINTPYRDERRDYRQGRVDERRDYRYDVRQSYAPPRDYRPSPQQHHPRYTHFYPGRRFHSLPRSYHHVTYNHHHYYYHDGIFFRLLDGLYVVVDAPIGAVVASLPSGLIQLSIGGRLYYTDYDTYYRWDDHQAGYVVSAPPHVVVQTAPQTIIVQPPAQTLVVEQPSPVNGTHYTPGQLLEQLPPGSRSVTIDTIQYFLYGDTYFRPITINGGVRYLVAVPN